LIPFPGSVITMIIKEVPSAAGLRIEFKNTPLAQKAEATEQAAHLTL
jgi:hypothetical protein